MFGIMRSAPPTNALLVTHRGRHPERWGGYHDCFRICVRGRVTLQQFVVAFYTSRLFRLERALLRVFLAIPSSDADAYALRILHSYRETHTIAHPCSLHAKLADWNRRNVKVWQVPQAMVRAIQF